MTHCTNKKDDNCDFLEYEKVKIFIDYLEEIEKGNPIKYFGNWIDKVNEYKNIFFNALPFEHVVIDNFLNNEYAELLFTEFPNNYDNWHKYLNPIEVKYAYDEINDLHYSLKNYFYLLSTKQLIKVFSELTNIQDLEYDEYLHGAGLHIHPKYGRLNIHLDYEKHPISGKERRINVILFLNKEWDSNWNGANELWDENVTKCIQKTEIKFNRAIIFKTNDISWHGVPDIIKCPDNVFRKSLAYYYVSDLNTRKNEQDYRKKAKFIKRPQDSFNDSIECLYKIRENRRINSNDMKKYMPDWKVEDYI